jgi:hypothetical protein
MIEFGAIYGQDSTQVKGFINGDKDPFVNRNILLKMIIADSVYQSTFVTYNGFFRFFRLTPTKDYKVFCFAFDHQINNLEIKKIEKNGLDSLICKFDSTEIHSKTYSTKTFDTFVYFGYPVYTDFRLSLFSKKYGFLYENMGCIGGDERKINEKLIRKLNKDLGLDWENIIFIELEYWNKDTY